MNNKNEYYEKNKENNEHIEAKEQRISINRRTKKKKKIFFAFFYRYRTKKKKTTENKK
jgi:hypothetical protein